MEFRVLVSFALLGVACFLPHAGPGGLLERSPPEIWAVVVHFGVPSVLAVALVVLRPRLPWFRSIPALAGGLLFAQIVRMVLYAHPSGQQIWSRLLLDSKDLFLLVLSLSMQTGFGLMVLAAARYFARKAGQSSAPSDLGCAKPGE